MRRVLAPLVGLAAATALPCLPAHAFSPPSSAPAVTGSKAALAAARVHLAQGDAVAADALAAAALRTAPDDPELHLLAVDCALALGRPALASTRLTAAGPALVTLPAFQFRAAQIYFIQGALLGRSEVRAIAGGQPGQFVDGMLLVEPRPGHDQYLCCPPQSALYSLRMALDGGFDAPEGFVLHARIWQRLGRPEIGRNILETRAVELLAQPQPDTLAAFSELALATGDLAAYLRYERRRAALLPDERDEILFRTFVALAEACGQRGEERLYIEWLARAVRIHR